MTVKTSSPRLLIEMNSIGVYKTPPPKYLEWLTTSKAFFDGPEWGDVLQKGLGAQRFYLWDSVSKLGQALTCFRRGPFYIGYLGFPICAAPEASDPPYFLDRMISTIRAMPHRPQLLRLPTSAFGGRMLTIQAKTFSAVESCIADLQAWRSDETPVRRKDLKFARNRCDSMNISNNASGLEVFNIYAATVARHRGNMRYTSNYYAALEDMPKTSAIRTYAMNDDTGLAGMVLTADHGKSCYYLHGGTRPDVMRMGVADLLLAHSITNARERGLTRFNLLTSPQKQSGLIRFKEKWGGISLPAPTSDVPLNILGRGLARLIG